MNKPNAATLTIHIAAWMAVFLSPLMFINHGNGVSASQFMFIGVAQATLLVAFYANYFWLTPHYYMQGRKKMFWTTNIAMILLLGIGLHYWMEYGRALIENGHAAPPHIKQNPQRYFFMLRDMFNILITAILATTIRLAGRWKESERARHEAEAARSAAELKNLRAQINPHFLLNTLNNIYALTAFNTDKAQNAIMELSKLLRHMLYNNEERFVSLKSEVGFLANYVNLMKIRLAANVEVNMSVDIPDDDTIKIAPMIIISLIENAFKHGVSASGHCFINITIHACPDRIECLIENSNHPKTAADRSGHGIGLKQVAKRLDLLYPDKYEWTSGKNADHTIYSSKITIYDTIMHNN